MTNVQNGQFRRKVRYLISAAQLPSYQQSRYVNPRLSGDGTKVTSSLIFFADAAAVILEASQLVEHSSSSRLL
jgi:hypothetical protein